MPERRPPAAHRRLLGALGVTAAVGLGLAVPAVAQTSSAPLPARWSDTELDAPFDEFEVEVVHAPIEVTGTLRYEWRQPTDRITDATASLVDDPEDDFEPDPDCDFPPVIDLPDGEPAGGSTTELPIDVAFDVECNSRYLLRIEARGGEDDDMTLLRSVVVEIPPPPIEEVEAELDVEQRQVTMTWTPLADDDLAPDIVGYRVERAGPATDDDLGTYAEIAVLERSDEPTILDPIDESGTYSYRVRALKSGPGDPVPSTILGAGSAEVYAPPPATTTTTTTEPEATPTTRGPRIGTAIPRPPGGRSVPTFAPPTTADTGFEERLDYDEPAATSTTTDTAAPELANEDLGGQSIVRDESEGIDMVVPAAGALVLLGWAGHLVYLNRLARQLS